MSDEVFRALVKYVETRCLVDEALIQLRVQTVDIANRARALDANWKKSAPHSSDQTRAMELIPRVNSVLLKAQEIQFELNDRQSIEIKSIRSLIQDLQANSAPDPMPLLNRLLENDERRLRSDIAAMGELLGLAEGDLAKGEDFVRTILASRSAS